MKQSTKALLKVDGMLVLILVSLLVMILFSGCTTTKYVEVEKIRTDTLIETRLMYDSIHIHDSVQVKEKGDSVLIERWHTKYFKEIVKDTVYKAKHDTIPKPYPVTKEVPAQLNLLQKTLMYIGGAVLIALLFYVFYLIIKMSHRF